MDGYLARNIRKQLGLNQKELAKMANVSRKEIDTFEKNEPLKLLDKQKILARLFAEKAKKSYYN